MTWKVIYDNQLFVFYNGILIYKKWLLTGESLVFDVGFAWSPAES